MIYCSSKLIFLPKFKQKKRVVEPLHLQAFKK